MPAIQLLGAVVSEYADLKETCVFCESGDLFGLPAVIAETPWPVCQFCASLGAALLAEGEVQPVLHCLHLVAMEFEEHLPGFVDPKDRDGKKWLFRIRRQFARGAFREVCPCSTCMGEGETVVLTDLHDQFDVQRETYADTMPLNVLQSMAPYHKVKASDGFTWRAVDEIARRLQANAQETRYPAPPKTALSRKAVKHLHGGSKAEDLARYQAAVRRFGPGYLDGEYFVTDSDGVCHPFPRRKQ
jgi:hypothetical protein